jgi:hypothetical protein
MFFEQLHLSQPAQGSSWQAYKPVPQLVGQPQLFNISTRMQASSLANTRAHTLKENRTHRHDKHCFSTGAMQMPLTQHTLVC